MARSALVLFCLVGASCDAEQETREAASVGRVVEVVPLRSSAAPHLVDCDGPDACHEVGAGDAVAGARLATDAGTSATVQLEPGGRLLLSPSTAVRDLDALPLTLERGAISLETDRGAQRSIRVGTHEIAVDASRSAKLVVASDGEEATVTVHRGAATVTGQGGERRLGRGESLTLSEHEVRAVFAPPAAFAEAAPASSARGSLRGLGRMTARIPGREEVAGGVRLARHEVRVEVRAGVATTTVEEVFENESDRVLEGRFVFPVPAEASVSRLALWVGDELVEGEMVEKRRAATIFKGIVDDTVRPRDPALLEWAQGSELSLKIFPMPAKGTRRVLLSYEEPISELAGSARYVYPLSAGEDRETSVGQFVITARVEGDDVFDVATPSHGAAIANERGATTVSFASEGFTPDRDFVLTWQRPRREGAVATVDREASATLVRAALTPSEQVSGLAPRGSSRVIVLDASRSQSRSTLAAQAALAKAAVASMEEGERFAVLACDSACVAYPEDGLASVSREMTDAMDTWLARLAPSGSSDLAGAITAGASRLPQTDGAQLVVLSDGTPSSGELEPAAVSARARRAVPAETDVRLFGVGRNVDDLVLRAVADGIEGTYERLDPGASPQRRVDEIVLSLAQPVIRAVEVESPGGLTLAAAPPRALRLGEELRISGLGSVESGATLRVRGRLGREPFEQALAVSLAPGGEGVAARSYARARIDALTTAGAIENGDEIVMLSRRYFVMSRQTSLLVLENDAMFRAFGIERTRGSVKEPRELPSAPPKVRMGGTLPPAIGLVPADPPAARWGAVSDSLSAKGHLWGDEIGDSFGAGGLGLSGVGEGGGGRGESIGLGSIGTIGRGAGIGTGSGFGSGSGRLGGSHRTDPPKVRMGSTAVSGRLPPEVIRRIVRQSFGRFRLCYENGLRESPDLAGTVTIAFAIGADGTVSTATDGGSTLPDAKVKSCVVSAVRGLTFPAPEGGVVTVRFPVSFAPGDGAAPSSVIGGAGRPGWSGPTADARPVTHVADDAWGKGGEAELERLRSALAADETKRSAHVALIKRLVFHGRFEEAVARATRFVEVDPDSDVALDLFAQASLATGDRQAALAALDGLAELAPRSARVHRRAARGLEAAGDERRGCAHWLSLSSLDREDREARLESLRCRARVLGERSVVASEISDAPSADADLKALRSAVELGAVPAYAARPAADVVAVKVECDTGARCPAAITIDGAGRVVSPLLPGERGEAWSRASSGPVRTLLAGRGDGWPARLTVTASGRSRTVTLEAPSSPDRTFLRTSVLTTISD